MHYPPTTQRQEIFQRLQNTNISSIVSSCIQNLAINTQANALVIASNLLELVEKRGAGELAIVEEVLARPNLQVIWGDCHKLPLRDVHGSLQHIALFREDARHDAVYFHHVIGKANHLAGLAIEDHAVLDFHLFSLKISLFFQFPSHILVALCC